MGKNKFEKLQDETMKQLMNIRSKIDPRTFSSFQSNIFGAVGQSALYKLMGKFETINELQDTVKYTKATKAKETNINNKKKNIEAVSYFKQPLQEYFLKADLKLNIEYRNTRTAKSNKNGRVKGEKYEHIHNKEKIINDFSKKIKARSKADAIEQFKKMIESENNSDNFGIDSIQVKGQSVVGVDNISATSLSSFESSEPEMMMMRKYNPLIHNFIPSDDKLLKNEGFCVPDQFVGTYSKFIKELTLDYFIELCYQVRGEVASGEKQISSLDVGISDDEDDLVIINKKWELSDGVSPKMLTDICKILNISTYAFDITQKCFLKYISKNRNYKAFIYYAVDRHCYHITAKDAAKSLVEQAKDIEHKIKSNCIIEDIIEKKSVNNFETMEIKEDVPISELMNHNDCIIIYKKNDLNEELNE